VQKKKKKISFPHWQQLRLLLTTVRLQQKAAVSGFRSAAFARNEKMKLVEFVAQSTL
jgi:hypothetical protein